MDFSVGNLPARLRGALVAATDSCVAIGTLSQIDGETTIMLTDSIEGLSVGALVFDGVLVTPSREISVCNVHNEKLLTLPLKALSVRIRVFANDLSEPDDIVVFADTNSVIR